MGSGAGGEPESGDWGRRCVREWGLGQEVCPRGPSAQQVGFARGRLRRDLGRGRRSKPILSSDPETPVSTPFSLLGREAGVTVIIVH